MNASLVPCTTATSDVTETTPADDFSRYANRPTAFALRFVCRRFAAHAVILAAVLTAVGCSVGTQYGIKLLVDTLTRQGAEAGANAWPAFGLLVGFIAADSVLWRLAGFVAHATFVGVTGDVRRDLFRHVTGHAPGYFSGRMPGTLASRLTATSNAVFAVENMYVWNVVPPCVATAVAVSLVGTVSLTMAGTLTVVAGVMVVILFRLAAAGQPLHHDFASKAAAVDGEMVDVIANMPLVLSFCGLGGEYRRFDATVAREMAAHRSSLFYLERLRILHTAITIVLAIGILGWAISLWERGAVTTGDVILACTLGLSVLHATRDLAVALVGVTQHFARLAEALATLLQPHELRDHPEAACLVRRGASVALEHVVFSYANGDPVFKGLDLRIEPGQRVGLVGPSGGGKSSLLALIQRFYDLHGGRITIDGQDIARVTQESLRASIAVVPQDLSLFNRTAMENIRYGRPDATDAEVVEATEFAGCREFIEALPKGFATVVGDRGVHLSGGQRQRIAIARAFLKDAPLLLLDEATSALDGVSEEAIQDALARLMHGRTVIAIAHRLSTVSNFDRIVVLRTGQVVQDGPPGELMAQEGLYRSLVRREMSRLAKQAA
ncbi:MAG: ABC transporter ATP-binding protein [Bradyrhizobiaceae bacterium]|nr:ABC transporter ATP-binding protein [Bradyrhizobiaceae bacterium]